MCELVLGSHAYLNDAEQVNVFNHIKLGDGDARLLLELLSRLHVSILDAVVQHEDENVAPPLDQPLLLLCSSVVIISQVRYQRDAKAPVKHAHTARRLSFCALSCINELMVAAVIESTMYVVSQFLCHQLTNCR